MKPETHSAPNSPLPPAVPKEQASGGEASPVVDSDLALRTVLLLQSLLEKVMGDRVAEEKRRKAAVKRTYTPRSQSPLSRLATLPAMPTRMRRRSLHFSCPCCGRETVIIRRQAGARLRCPHCQSAVAAPHPSRRRSAHSLQRDIESMLHPESFVPAIRPTAPRWGRMIAKEPILILALAALVPFTALLMIEVPGVIEKSKGGVPSTMAQAAPEEPGNAVVPGAADRAVALVERYLAAPTSEAKAALVRDPQRVAPLMASLASRQPDHFAPVVGAQVKAAGLSHYQDPSNPVPVTPVVARFADGSARTFLVEHAPEGDAIEWESSTGSSEPLALVAAPRGKKNPAARAVWRVEAAPDDYFNRAFADEDGLICLKLARADRPDETFWAYAPKEGELGETLRRIWNESPRDFAQRLTVTVEANPSTAKTHQVRLAAVNHAGWRTPTERAALVAGNP